MELTFSKQPVLLSELILDTDLEQAVECDLLLPDYCPDILKILRCEAQTNVTSAQVSGGKLNIGATSTVRVFYLGEGGNIRSTEQQVTHARTVELKAAADAPVAEVTCQTRYLNCRAVNERRFEVRGALNLHCRVTNRREEQLIADSNFTSLQMKKTICDISELVACVSKPAEVREELELGSGKPAVANIIRSCAHYRLLDYKIIAGKIITKGELLVHLLYQTTEEGQPPETMSYTLPVSQILDVDKADEDSRCCLSVEVTSLELTVRSDLDGESRTIGLQAGLCFHVALYRDKQVSLVEDCYCTEYALSMRAGSVTLQRLLRTVQENGVYQELVDMPEGLARILDLWCELEGVSTRLGEGALLVVMKLKICMFAATEDGAGYFDRAGEFEYAIPLEETVEEPIFTPAVGILSTAYSITPAEKIEVRVELSISGGLCSNRRLPVAEEIVLDTTKPRGHEEDDSGLIVYYAQAGEPVWDIAKRYNTSLAAIMEENALDGERLPDKRMLLIPITL